MKNLLEELTKEMRKFREDVEEENDIYSMSFFLKTKRNGEWWMGGQKKFLETIKKINFNSKKGLIEKIKPYFEDFIIKTSNFCYELDTNLESDNIIIGWQWKAL